MCIFLLFLLPTSACRSLSAAIYFFLFRFLIPFQSRSCALSLSPSSWDWQPIPISLHLCVARSKFRSLFLFGFLLLLLCVALFVFIFHVYILYASHSYMQSYVQIIQRNKKISSSTNQTAKSQNEFGTRAKPKKKITHFDWMKPIQTMEPVAFDSVQIKCELIVSIYSAHRSVVFVSVRCECVGARVYGACEHIHAGSFGWRRMWMNCQNYWRSLQYYTRTHRQAPHTYTHVYISI